MQHEWFPFRFDLMIAILLLIAGTCMADADTLKANIAAKPHLRWVASKTSPPNLFKEHETYAQESPCSDPGTRSTIETQLDSQVSIVFENTHLLEILEYLREDYDINIAVDYRAVAPPRRVPINYYAAPPDHADVANGIIPHINFRNGSFRNALTALLRPLNLTYSIESSYVWISSPALLEADAARPKPNTNSASEALLASLSAPLTLEMEDVHIQEFVDFVSHGWKVHLVLDLGVVKRKHSSPSKPDSLDSVTDGIIPYMNERKVKLSEALDVALRPLNLTYMAEGNMLWISSYGRIGKFSTPTTGGKPVP
jgi:hypothetical protein